MLSVKIHEERYDIMYDLATTTITCEGSLRLYGGNEYASIMDLFYIVADQKPPQIKVDVRNLRFLNSSGINVFYKFVIRVRDYHESRLVVQGSQTIFWQSKLLTNFQRLMPDAVVELNGQPINLLTS